MSFDLSLTVEGNPIPKERPRVVLRAGQRARAYTPQKTRTWERRIAYHAKAAMGGREPVVGPVAIDLQFYRKDATRADGDNLEKAVTDALNGVVYLDDDQIIECHRYKRIDRRRPRVEIRIWKVGGER